MNNQTANPTNGSSEVWKESKSSLFNFQFSIFNPLTLGALVLLGYWLLVFNALRVDWSVNPQYYYGWFVPLLALGLFRLRWNGRPPAAAPADNRAVTILASIALAALFPIRLIEEANPEWRLIQWTHAAQMVFVTLCALYYI